MKKDVGSGRGTALATLAPGRARRSGQTVADGRVDGGRTGADNAERDRGERVAADGRRGLSREVVLLREMALGVEDLQRTEDQASGGDQDHESERDVTNGHGNLTVARRPREGANRSSDTPAD